MKLRIVSLLLVLVMLLSFAACDKQPVNPSDTSGVTDTDTGDDTTLEGGDIHTGDEVYNVTDYLPDENFDGEDIYVWVDATYLLFYGIPEDYFEEGDIVHEAVIKRNEAVENQFGVTLTYDQQYAGGWRDQGSIRQSILAGDEYDLLCGVALYQNKQLLYGCFVDLADNEYIDDTKPWYFNKMNKSLAVNDHQYVISGYYDFPTITRSSVVFFNAPLAMDFRLGNMYQLVKDNEWTWDKMVEIAESVSQDVNNDGIYDENDRFGAAGRWDYYINLPSTTGYQYVTHGEDGEYALTGVTDDLLEIGGKIYPFITKNNAYYSSYTYGVQWSWPTALIEGSKKMFTNGQVLFLMEGLVTVQEQVLREFGDYGILPTPLLLDSQTEYGTATSPFVSSICSTTGSLRKSSIILEALEMESYNILRPAFVNDALSYKYLTDPEAKEMLNYIFSVSTTDWAYNFCDSALYSSIPTMISSQEFLYSYFASERETYDIQLEEFLYAFEEIPEFQGNP